MVWHDDIFICYKVTSLRLYCSGRTYCSPEDGSGSQKRSLLTVATTSSVLTILSTDTSSHLNPLPNCVLCPSQYSSENAQPDFRNFSEVTGFGFFRNFTGLKKENRFIVHRNRDFLGKVSETFPKFGEIWTKLSGIISEINGPDTDFGGNISEKLSEIRWSIHSNIVSHALFPIHKGWPQSPKLSWQTHARQITVVNAYVCTYMHARVRVHSNS